MIHSIITGTGSYIPPVKVPNRQFLENEFYQADGTKNPKANEDIVTKLQEITCIRERRYIEDDFTTSDMAYQAAENALDGIDRESLDYIIVAQNLGDVKTDNITPDMVPTIAARVKHKLRIKNPYTVAYDIPFGCPGWLQGMITADYYIKSGDARRVMIIGAETLSRVADPHDVDCMIYSDGAGATVLEASENGGGVLAHVTRSDTYDNAYLLTLGQSYSPNRNGSELFVKMQGHEIYKYAVRTVPKVVKQSLDKAGLTLSDVKKVLIHQANQKMDEAILERLFKLYKIDDIPGDIMPMTISWLGNSSVATLPTMLDLLQKGKLESHNRLQSGDIVVFASVGAGMNINSMVYKMQ
ncbi:MAG: ketoacyl-ACP synthase III [Desulfobacteraceae bacterium]|jgi:3-oxoacyl-[acyl-carrier-protein] synthase-3|nr:ketoacyl-ACP synthase III [Desulfobacteraceae bacterium]